MTNGSNFSDQNRVDRTNVNRQRTDRVTEQTVSTTVYDENGQPIVTDDAVNARPVTRDEVSYRNGYVEGQNRQRVHEDIQRNRAENSAATGTLIGILIASIAGLVLAALYFLPGNRESQITPAPATSPAQSQDDTQDTQPEGTNRTTIIERERVREVPAPQNTEIIVPPSTSEPAPPASTQPSLTQPDLTQPAPTQSSGQASPDSSDNTVPDSSVSNPVDPAIPADPDQSPSQSDTNSGTTGGTGTAGE